MMKILITDDEAPARQRLQRLLQDIGGDFEVVAEAVHGRQALELYNQFQPNLILMDIRMPGMDGLEAAKHLSQLEQPPAVIFVTAYDDHALQAFETHAVDYLLKPIRKERLQQALQKAHILTQAQVSALDQVQSEEALARSHICVQVRGNLKLIPVRDILYFRAEQKYVTVRHTNGEVLIEEPLKSLEVEFKDKFVRIHRNALVAKQFMEGLEKDREGHCIVKIRGVEDRLEISRRHVTAIRKMMKSGNLPS